MLRIESPDTRKKEGTQGVLHVLFLAGGNGLAAQMAAHWARLLADDCLEVEAADSDGVDSTAALGCAPVGLVVVIHTPSYPGPVVAHNCGGRIDWNLTVDVNEATAELNAQLRRHAMRLLGDIGISRVHSDLAVTLRPHPPTVIDRPDRTNARASLLAA